jgi:hypothetical protein
VSRIVLFSLLVCLVGMVAWGCQTTISTALPTDEAANLLLPDGIDPKTPNVERTSIPVDFAGVKTIRIELPTGRVTIHQVADANAAGMRSTELVTKEGLGADVYAQLLEEAVVTASRSFVDSSRLDIEAIVPEALLKTEIAYDVRLVIPASANIEVILDSGPVVIKDLIGNVEIQTGNGSIDVEHVQGNVIAETTLRAINVADVTGNVVAKTSKDDIEIRLAPIAGAVVSAITTEGDIRLAIAKTTAAALSLTATDGAVSANLAGFAVTNVSTGNGLLTGILNGGGGSIEAQTTGGEIEFNGM